MADNAANNAAPSLNALAQYCKDFSFENPNAPASIMSGAGQPQFNVSINVGVKKQSDELYAVELTYSGVFRIQNIPQEQLHPVVMIECPRLLFPFARQMVADAVRNGGFPPLYIDPIDFVALYRQRAAEVQGQENGAGQTLS